MVVKQFLYVFKILWKEVDNPGCFYTRHSAKREITLRNTIKLTGKPGLKKVIEAREARKSRETRDLHNEM